MRCKDFLSLFGVLGGNSECEDELAICHLRDIQQDTLDSAGDVSTEEVDIRSFRIVDRGAPDLSRGMNRFSTESNTLSPRTGILYAGRAPTKRVYAIGDEIAVGCVS